MRVLLYFAILAVLLCSGPTQAQDSTRVNQRPRPVQKSKQKPAKPSVKVLTPSEASKLFRPTCNLDSGSVGFYFFPANLGAKWAMRTTSRLLDETNKLLKADTTYSYERVISDSNRTLQGLPILTCLSSLPYHEGGRDSGKTQTVEYYVDDSSVIAVMNHSVTNGLSRILLVNPLKVGASWHDNTDDTIRSKVIAIDEPITTLLGTFPRSLVVQSRLGLGELTKYFVPGVGIVKTEFRGLTPRQNGTLVVTTELITLERGNPKRSLKFRFNWPAEKTLKLLPLQKTKKKAGHTDGSSPSR